MKNLRNFWHHLKLGQMLGLVLLVIFALITAIGVAGILHVVSVYNKEMYNLSVSNSRSITSELDGIVDSINVFGDYFVGDDIIQSNLLIVRDSNDQAELSIAKRALMRRLNSLQGTLPHVKDMTLIISNNDSVHSGDAVPYFSHEDMISNNQRAIAAQGKSIWVSDMLGNTYYVRQIRERQYLRLDHLAILYLKIDIGSLLEKIQNRYNSDDEILITVQHDNTVLFSNLIDATDRHHNDVDRGKNYSFMTVDGNKYLVIHENSPNDSWQYTHYLNYQAISNQIAKVVLKSGLMLLLAMLIALLIVHFIVRKIIKHLKVLEDKMAYFESGNMDMSHFPSYSKRTDEIGVLHQHFNRMVHRFDTLITDNYLKQLLIKDNTIKMLSQQINPHFLNNVLDSICWLAESYEAFDIAQMSYSLAHLLRLSITDDQACVPLHQEMEFLDHYVKIQQVRFTDRLNVIQQVPPEALDVIVPRFSIQPLFENAIKHSMELSDEVCTVHLSAECTDDLVQICVSNTGSQFDENIADLVRSRQIKETGSIGLVNIDERLRLLFGNQCGLNFENRAGLAIVSFSIPRGGHT